MLCLYCGKHVGFIRRLTDSDFCCSEHRVKMRTRSARALREIRDVEPLGDDETLTAFVQPIDGLRTKKPQNQSTLTSSLVFGMLLAGAVFVGAVGLPQSGSTSADRGRSSSNAAVAGYRKLLPSQGSFKTTYDFRNGLSSWVAPGSSATTTSSGWSVKDGLLRPGRLRVLNASQSLSNYNVEFVGQIERRALSWVYRATNDRNYYATKILISKPGPLPTADVVRYAVVNGIETNRVSFPLPMNIRTDTIYTVRVSLSGSDFNTVINGQMVDTWSDRRLPSGGFGFFANAGEVAVLRYVTITDKDSVLGRVLSHFGFVDPSLLLQ